MTRNESVCLSHWICNSSACLLEIRYDVKLLSILFTVFVINYVKVCFGFAAFSNFRASLCASASHQVSRATNSLGTAKWLCNDSVELVWSNQDALNAWVYPKKTGYSFAKDKFITVSKFCQSPALHDLFHLPLSEEAYQQFIQLSVTVESLNLQEGFDSWSYVWNSNVFTPKHVYKHLIGNVQVHPVYSWLWKSCCMLSEQKKILFLVIIER
jgi:hypothetical protein